MNKDTTRSAAKPIAVLASVILCVVLAVFGMASAAWADEATDAAASTEGEAVVVEESPTDATAAETFENEAAEATADVSATLSVSVHQQDIGWTEGVASGVTAGSTGSDLRVEAIALTLTADVSGSISYSVDCRDYGWTEWASDGATAGVTGESQPITAIKVQLTDEAASAYDVWYRVWVDGYGWTGWAKNGAPAGTTSFDAILEGVEVVILAAGSEAPGDVAPAVITSSFESDDAEAADEAAATEETAADEAAVSEDASTEETEEAAEAAEAGAESDAAAEETVTEASDSGTGELAEFEEIVVADNEYCSITITGIEENTFLGISLGLELEVTLVNKSATTTYVFVSSDGAVEGVEAYLGMYEQVAPGKTAYATIDVDSSDLDDMGVTYTDIELNFYAYDADDWTADYVVDTIVHVYPYGEEAATTFVRETQETDVVLIDNDYVTVTLVSSGSTWSGYALELYVQNKTDTEIMMSVDDASINGIMCDPTWAATLGAGHSSYETISWYSSQLEESNVSSDSISTIELTFVAYDWDDWLAADFVNQVITITPTNS